MEIIEKIFEPKHFTPHWRDGEIPGSRVLGTRPDAGNVGCIWPGRGGLFYAMRSDCDRGEAYPSFAEVRDAIAWVEAPARQEHEAKEAKRLARWTASEERRKERAHCAAQREAERLAAPKKKDTLFAVIDQAGEEVARVARKTLDQAVRAAAQLMGASELPKTFHVQPAAA